MYRPRSTAPSRSRPASPSRPGRYRRPGPAAPAGAPPSGSCATAPAEAAADFERAQRLLEKGRAGQEVNVGIECQRHNGDRALQRADLREPVVVSAPAEPGAERALDGASELQEIGVCVGH